MANRDREVGDTGVSLGGGAGFPVRPISSTAEPRNTPAPTPVSDTALGSRARTKTSGSLKAVTNTKIARSDNPNPIAVQHNRLQIVDLDTLLLRGAITLVLYRPWQNGTTDYEAKVRVTPEGFTVLSGSTVSTLGDTGRNNNNMFADFDLSGLPGKWVIKNETTGDVINIRNGGRGRLGKVLGLNEIGTLGAANVEPESETFTANRGNVNQAEKHGNRKQRTWTRAKKGSVTYTF